MNRTQKKELVEAFGQKLEGTPLVVLADFRRLDVAGANAFRRDLEKAGVHYEVVKNTLALRVIEGTQYEGLAEHLVGMTGWVISGEDPISTAKALREAVKDLEKKEQFTYKGGFFEGDVLDADAIKKVADLPSREELLVSFLRTIQEGPRQMVGVIAAPARDLVNLLKNYENKLAESE